MSGRFANYAFVALASAWILVPIYLLTVSALGGEEVVNAWPKSFLPILHLDTIEFFFGVEGVWRAIVNSVLVAMMTMVFAIGMGAPAGYALARFQFRGKDAYRLLSCSRSSLWAG